MLDFRRHQVKGILGTALLLLSFAPARGWAQPVDLLDPHSVEEAAKKKPRPPRGFPVQPGIYRLHGTDPGLPQDDLEPLRQIIGKAGIVALGESFHTSGGHYEMKHRLFRFLVEKMGFRAIAFENPWPDTDRVGRYVETCEGSPEEALTGLLGPWQSTEIRDLVQWMCDWNRTHPRKKDKLRFFGFDVQQPEQDAEALFAFLERIGVGSGDPRAVDITACDSVGAPSVYPAPVPEAGNQRCVRGLDAVERLFNEDARRIAAETSRAELEYARLRLVGLRSWQGQAYYKDVRSMLARDGGMAYAFRALRQLRYGNVKTVVWAHNFHIAKDAAAADWGAKSMGAFLREMFGPSYVSLALIAEITEIDWPTHGCGARDVRHTERSLERMLLGLGHEALLVDLDFPGGKPPFLSPGARYEMNEVGMVPAGQFDGAVFVERSRKMDPLAWPSCQ
ncbi:MAG TPA: erythromycin esterase family protein [Thermoanaerobaculia bacterium]|nr:erythromycin esterase family protein [Thermoanaerobaculia bacterium]